MRLFLLILLFVPTLAMAQDAFRSTPYPLPRFVSLRSDEVNARTGPGKQYPIRYKYARKNLPVEIILEYEGWRKIRDHEGAESWVHQTLLSGRRSALVNASAPVPLYSKARSNTRQEALIGPMAVILLKRCDTVWCEAQVGTHKGWILRKYLWGVYQNENF